MDCEFPARQRWQVTRANDSWQLRGLDVRGAPIVANSNWDGHMTRSFLGGIEWFLGMAMGVLQDEKRIASNCGSMLSNS